ncbi:hypothetical protein PIB30_070448 [Stylosanthes scabra]|uniref:Uncharacterized protein n=1 Tax=Stylosanthes scabra TaxID=79078 RepID=A0ABU6YQC9_9FABA|nr:hypothetical protein [Stylosanthes scabra]
MENSNIANTSQLVNKYILQIHALANALASAGSTISKQEHVSTILAGLCSKYDVSVTTIKTSSNSHSIPKVEKHITTHAARVESNAKRLSVLSLQAHFASTGLPIPFATYLSSI